MLVGAAITIALVGGGASPAWASEPDNGTFSGAEGPVAGSVTAAISSDGDADWYYFYVPALTDVTWRLDATDGQDYRIWVHRYEAGYLETIDWDNGTSVSYQKTVQLPAGLYYVRVAQDHTWIMDYPGTYQLTLSGAVSGYAPDHAHTHRPGTPMPEVYETSYAGAQWVRPYENHLGSIQSEGDTDWYKFAVTSIGTVVFGCTDMDSPSVAMSIYGDPGLSPLASVTNGVSSLILNPGVYYVRFENTWAAPPAPYLFDIQGPGVSAEPVYPTAPPPPAAPPYTKVSLSRKTSWATLKHGRTYYAKGLIGPTHQSAAPKMVILAYKRRSNGSYPSSPTKTFKTGSTYAAYSASRSMYRVPVKFSKSMKGRWKLVAYHRADAANAATRGTPDYVTVK